MTQPIHLIGSTYAVEVADPNNAIISGNVVTWKTATAQGRGFIVLPPGNWQIICTTKGVTEDVAAQIVEQDTGGFTGRMIGFKDYSIAGCDMEPLPTAIMSLHSLLTSEGLDVNKNFIIIKKIS